MAASCISCIRKLALIAITVRALVTELLHLRCGHLEEIFEGVAVTSGEAAVDAELFRVILGETSVAKRNVLLRFVHAFECVAGIAGGDLPEDTDQIVGLSLLSDAAKTRPRSTLPSPLRSIILNDRSISSSSTFMPARS